MKNISFKDFMQRLKQDTPIQNQSQLAETLNLGRSAISLAKSKDIVPSKWVFYLAEKYDLDTSWLATGKKQTNDIKNYSLPKLKKVKIPKGDLSLFEDQQQAPNILIESNILKQKKINNEILYIYMPNRSMEPEILAGDLLLADPMIKDFNLEGIYILRHEDNLLIRRVEVFQGIVRLLSPNPQYNILEMKKDEIGLENILGKIIVISRMYC